MAIPAAGAFGCLSVATCPQPFLFNVNHGVAGSSHPSHLRLAVVFSLSKSGMVIRPHCFGSVVAQFPVSVTPSWFTWVISNKRECKFLTSSNPIYFRNLYF